MQLYAHAPVPSARTVLTSMPDTSLDSPNRCWSSLLAVIADGGLPVLQQCLCAYENYTGNRLAQPATQNQVYRLAAECNAGCEEERVMLELLTVSYQLGPPLLQFLPCSALGGRASPGSD